MFSKQVKEKEILQYLLEKLNLGGNYQRNNLILSNFKTAQFDLSAKKGIN